MIDDARLRILNDIGIDVWQQAVPAVKADTASNSKADVLPDWESLEQTVAKCNLCNLGAIRTNVVFGVGNKTAELMVIGEAPGKDEDLQGEPFVGRAGQLLDKMLQAINFNRNEVYIANILKCRPPNNRDPELGEIKQCKKHLNQQIRLVAPRVILCAGRIAAQTLLKTSRPVASLRGKVHEFKKIPLVITYHPAYLLRKPAEKARAWRDLKQVLVKLKSD